MKLKRRSLFAALFSAPLLPLLGAKAAPAPIVDNVDRLLLHLRNAERAPAPCFMHNGRPVAVKIRKMRVRYAGDGTPSGVVFREIAKELWLAHPDKKLFILAVDRTRVVDHHNMDVIDHGMFVRYAAVAH